MLSFLLFCGPFCMFSDKMSTKLVKLKLLTDRSWNSGQIKLKLSFVLILLTRSSQRLILHRCLLRAMVYSTLIVLLTFGYVLVLSLFPLHDAWVVLSLVCYRRWRSKLPMGFRRWVLMFSFVNWACFNQLSCVGRWWSLLMVVRWFLLN